ncbi:uncharacterized protein [Cicer arietinum]|uniref:uncharacterized protein n=1 Tax=Cicer arietinum TaxID=3827 RepID=UPI003CC66870
MDKSWISYNPNNSLNKEKYIRGVTNFLDFAFAKSNDGKILCPCTNCVNCKWRSRVDIYEHLVHFGFQKGYVTWVFHGEQVSSSSSQSVSQVEGEFDHDIDTLIHDAFGIHPTNESDGANLNVEDKNPKAFIDEANTQQFEDDSNLDKLYQLLNEAEQNLYPGCLSYEKIHACPNDCILYWRDSANAQICSKCGMSRWKLNSNDNEGRKKVPAKVLRWFPLKPRLQRLFLSSKIASSMTWHKDGRTKDGLMRHPADSFAWKYFDSQHPDFSCDPRNVRLGLASDGFNPFKTMSISHSTWPIVLIPYNLPPWMCMKQPNFILSLLIPGPKGPGNKLDIYMQPLVEELKELWEIGVKTFDACKKESFQMRAAIMWTINDFPAYANLSGWSTKGRYACPCCGLKTASHWLRYSRKFCYMCDRRWLEPTSKWRYNRGEFDGTQEFRAPPELPNGASVLRQLEDHGIGNGSPWKKKSILFTLPYWQHNVLRHNLDVMHIEKNVCDNIIGTLLHLDGKSKDNDKARYDLVDMNIRSQLHPTMHPSKGKKYFA